MPFTIDTIDGKCHIMRLKAVVLFNQSKRVNDHIAMSFKLGGVDNFWLMQYVENIYFALNGLGTLILKSMYFISFIPEIDTLGLFKADLMPFDNRR